MTNQEINYFLDEVTAKQELIESIEGLREEMRKAMAPMMEPVYKKPKPSDGYGDVYLSRLLAMETIFKTDLNQYEKMVWLYMEYTSHPQSANQIAKACSISIGSVKRAISALMSKHIIMRAPFEPGYILTKFSEA